MGTVATLLSLGGRFVSERASIEITQYEISDSFTFLSRSARSHPLRVAIFNCGLQPTSSRSTLSPLPLSRPILDHSWPRTNQLPPMPKLLQASTLYTRAARSIAIGVSHKRSSPATVPLSTTPLSLSYAMLLRQTRYASMVVRGYVSY